MKTKNKKECVYYKIGGYCCTYKNPSCKKECNKIFTCKERTRCVINNTNMECIMHETKSINREIKK